MSTSMNRRNWLKTSGLLASGLSIAPSFLQKAAANPSLQQELYADLSHEFRAIQAMNHMPPAAVKARLGANENPWGLSPKTKETIVNTMAEANRYPMGALRELYKVIADKEGIPLPPPEDGFKGSTKSYIKLGCGSSELLTASLMYYGQKGTIMVADPSYISGNEEKVPMDKVKLTADYQYDLDAMAAKADPAKHSLIYICNPNNPTGNIIPADKLRAFIDKVSDKVPVLVDEAYIDYAKDPIVDCMVDKIKEGKNVIILRTMSKLYAFAGMRMGYALGKPELLNGLGQYTLQGFGLSALTIAAAITAMQDKDYSKQILTNTAESKEYLLSFLKSAGYTAVPSYTNFVLFPIKMKGMELTNKMRQDGVMVRNWFFDAQHWCRVSIGKMDEMKAFTESFTKIVS
ncbi:MAG: histidinol-phosphate transaminase [Spirosomataceae bacterium]